MIGAVRWANAVSAAGTRAIAPPRTRIWTIAVGDATAIADRIESIGVVVEGVQEPRADDAAARSLARGGELVDARIRHRHDGFGDRRRDPPERLERRVAVGRVAAPDEHHDERELAVSLGRDERDRRDRHEERDRRELLRGARGDRHEARSTSVVGGRKSAPPRTVSTG